MLVYIQLRIFVQIIVSTFKNNIIAEKSRMIKQHIVRLKFNIRYSSMNETVMKQAVKFLKLI